MRGRLHFMRSVVVLWVFLFVVGIPFAVCEETPKVYVCFHFDTEDYILPEADDAAKRIAEIFAARNVKAIFKVVGEKARVLEERGRDDVILALAEHDIAYHSTYHSIHPTPAEYARHLDWHEGVAEFHRREGIGVEIIKRVFGVTPSCYGEPGGTWTPHAYPALRDWGIPLYLDKSRHAGIDHRPFWYGGMLNTNGGIGHVSADSWTEKGVLDALEDFERAYRQLSEEGGGLIQFTAHPCEFIHEDFWDAVNFGKGATPPRSEWKLPPVKSLEKQEEAFRALDALLAHILRYPNVQVVTGREIPALYPDKAYSRPLERSDLLTIAKGMREQLSYVDLGTRIVSAAEGLFAIAVLAAEAEDDYIPETVDLEFAYGPAGAPEEFATDATFRWAAVREAAQAVVEQVYEARQLPSVVWVAGKAVRPEDFAATLAAAMTPVLEGGRILENVPLVRAELEAKQYVADDSPRLWGWRIFPEGFEAPRMMALAKLQAWTLKPAVLRTQSE